MAYNAPRTWTTGEVVTAAMMNTEVRDNVTEEAKSGFNAVIPGGGAPITTASYIDVKVPYKCTIQECQLFADTVGKIVVDIWKQASSNYSTLQPTDSCSITASAPPTINSDDYTNQALTGWTTALGEDDMLRLYVESCTTIAQVTVSIDVSRSS